MVWSVQIAFRPRREGRGRRIRRTETDEEAYLLVEEDRDGTPALFSAIARAWRACRGEALAIAGGTPMILYAITPPLALRSRSMIG